MRSGRTRPTPATSQPTAPVAASVVSRSAAPSGTTAELGLAASASTSRCDGSRAAASTSLTMRTGASRRPRRARRWSSPERRRMAITSRSGRSARAAPASSGQPRTAIGSSCGKGSKRASRSVVPSSLTSCHASQAASAGSDAVRTRAQSHQSAPDAGWCETSRRHATTSPAGSSAKPARQSAASETSALSSSSDQRAR